jgi:hypothetical protein
MVPLYKTEMSGNLDKIPPGSGKFGGAFQAECSEEGLKRLHLTEYMMGRR